MTDITNLMNGPVREALKIPKNLVFRPQSSDVFGALSEDFMKPVTHVGKCEEGINLQCAKNKFKIFPSVEHVLNNTNIEVVVITGQLDLIVDSYGTLHWADNLRWKGSAAWASAKRLPLVLQNYIEGYVTKANTLSFYWVNRSGHMVNPLRLFC